MELGALICTPRQPKCATCPIRKLCVAFRENRVTELPNLRKREKPTTRRFAAFVIERNRKYLVRQRPSGVVNAHLWEFPNVELNGKTDLRAIAKSALGFPPENLRPLCSIRHSITRYRITVDAYRVDAPRKSSHQGWHTMTELKQLSFPSAHRKILAHVAAIPN